MTQKEQVTAALLSIGGKGNFQKILDNIDTKNWKTKTPKRSLYSILAVNDEFLNEERGVWSYAPISGDGNNQNKEKGLYLITFAKTVTPSKNWFFFKIGMSEGRLSDRLKDYNYGLPVPVVETISSYPIPANIKIVEVEKRVRAKLLDSETSEYEIFKCSGENQREWLQIPSINRNEKAKIKKLEKYIKKIIYETVVSLTK